MGGFPVSCCKNRKFCFGYSNGEVEMIWWKSNREGSV